MIVRHEWEEPEFDDQGQTNIIEKKALVDAEISIRGSNFGFGVERLADGGLKLQCNDEDEFSNESLTIVTIVILTKADLDRIKELEKQGLI